MESLKNKSEFKQVFLKGKKLNTKHLILFVIEENINKKLRLGIVIKKKVGNAVKRNRLRRILKHAFREIEMESNKGLTILAVFRLLPSEELNPFSLNMLRIKKEIKFSFKKLGLKEGNI